MSFANRGVYAETKVKKYLEWWLTGDPRRDFERLTDAKAAGRTIKAAAADFEYFSHTHGFTQGFIEVKETEHDYRLARDKVPQLPRLRKRDKCGCTSFVLVYHSKIQRWRILDIETLATTGDKGSWNLSELPAFVTCDGALNSMEWDVFPFQTKE